MVQKQMMPSAICWHFTITFIISMLDLVKINVYWIATLFRFSRSLFSDHCFTSTK